MCHGQVGNAEVCSNRDTCTQRKIHLWKGLSFFPLPIFFLFCFCTKQVPCRNFPQLPSLPIDPRPQMTPPFFRHFSKGVVTLLNPFLHSGPLHPLPGPHQSQGIVSPLSPIDRFFPPYGKFPVYKMTKEMFSSRGTAWLGSFARQKMAL